MIDVDKNFLLTESKTFCMFPWIHMNVTPKGDILPCCTSNYELPVGNTKKTSLREAFNSAAMKTLRLDMLNGNKSKLCESCYKHEEIGPHSFRKYSIDFFKDHFDNIVHKTSIDGTVDEFHMIYFDVRFRNICNFKCRTCSSDFSSQWSAEERERTGNKKIPILLKADNGKGTLLEEVLSHIDHIETAYFAGGEPLITDEHYVILEEIIRKKRTDIVLRYNTNVSNLKFKNKDLLSLWKHFDKIEVSCSIDHYGERAEYIRHGTNWGTVESNLIAIRNLNFIQFQMNTVLSIFNYLTLSEFYTYLKSKNLIKSTDWYTTLFLATMPPYYSAQSLPIELKKLGKEKNEKLIKNNTQEFHRLNELINDAIIFTESQNTWKDNKNMFLTITEEIDLFRSENFTKTFPELANLKTQIE